MKSKDSGSISARLRRPNATSNFCVSVESFQTPTPSCWFSGFLASRFRKHRSGLLKDANYVPLEQRPTAAISSRESEGRGVRQVEICSAQGETGALVDAEAGGAVGVQEAGQVRAESADTRAPDPSG
jgi:hypothetical protein